MRPVTAWPTTSGTSRLGGGPPRRMTSFDNGGIFSFAWSRDAKRLAVVRGSRTQDVVLISNFLGKE